MTLFSLIFALLLEQWRPVGSRNRVILLFLSYAGALERYFNTGAHRHGTAAWVAAVVPSLVLVGAVYYFLLDLSPLLAWIWNVVALYFTMGFRQFSHSFTDINQALKNGDLPLARKLLGQWRGTSAAYLESSGIPAYVDHGALAVGLEGTYKVFVSAEMLEQARMATSPSGISDEELDFLATGERPMQ